MIRVTRVWEIQKQFVMYVVFKIYFMCSKSVHLSIWGDLFSPTNNYLRTKGQGWYTSKTKPTIVCFRVVVE